jgi:hypothetical protein
MHSWGTHRACDPFDGDIWDDVKRAHRGRDVVSGNLVASRFDMQSNSGRALKQPFTLKRAFEIAAAMGG